MSQENVDFLAGLFAAADSLDKEAMLAALPTLIEQACDPDIEWVEDPQRARRARLPGARGRSRVLGAMASGL